MALTLLLLECVTGCAGSGLVQRGPTLQRCCLHGTHPGEQGQAGTPQQSKPVLESGATLLADPLLIWS